MTEGWPCSPCQKQWYVEKDAGGISLAIKSAQIKSRSFYKFHVFIWNTSPYNDFQLNFVILLTYIYLICFREHFSRLVPVYILCMLPQNSYVWIYFSTAGTREVAWHSSYVFLQMLFSNVLLQTSRRVVDLITLVAKMIFWWARWLSVLQSVVLTKDLMNHTPTFHNINPVVKDETI